MAFEPAAAIEQCAVMRRHRVRRVSVAMEGRSAAFVREAEFTLTRPNPAYAGLLPLLAEFAEFTGVGQQVAMGMKRKIAVPERDFHRATYWKR